MEKRGRGAKGGPYEEEQVKARSCADDRTKSLYSNEFLGRKGLGGPLHSRYAYTRD